MNVHKNLFDNLACNDFRYQKGNDMLEVYETPVSSMSKLCLCAGIIY